MSRNQDLENLWDDFVSKLYQLEKVWDRFSSLARETPTLEYLDIRTQDIFARVSIWSEFEVALESMMNYWRSQGGISVFHLEQNIKTKQKGEK